MCQPGKTDLCGSIGEHMDLKAVKGVVRCVSDYVSPG